MDIQTTKLKLMQLLLDTQKEQILQSINDIFEKEEDLGFWDDLNSEDQLAIKDGIEQLDTGNHVSHESVREEVKERFNFE